ncbi:MAG: hypothetical protein HYV35_07315 [Lentisphaerae bacterium]|nr:hypothetical protein [Lentisphaerota bacterium]
MQTELKRFAVLRMGKVSALLYAFLTVIMLPFILIAMLLSPNGGASVIPMLIIVLLYPLLGFVGGVIMAALYNLAAKWVGGIRFTLDQSE